jgi:hypothetical protein
MFDQMTYRRVGYLFTGRSTIDLTHGDGDLDLPTHACIYQAPRIQPTAEWHNAAGVGQHGGVDRPVSGSCNGKARCLVEHPPRVVVALH